jgi:alpha-ketoglutarate-dependent taurine dioxygenase
MTRRVEIVPVDAPIGAIIKGINPGIPLGDDDRLTILRAISEFGVVVLRGHDSLPSLEAYRNFGRRFGPLRVSIADLSRFPGTPEVNLVSNREFDGVVGTGGSGLINWHGDMNFTCPATDFVVLDAVELPESGGGATRFADLCGAYDALSSHDQRRIELAEVRYFFRSDLPYAKPSVRVFSPSHIHSFRHDSRRAAEASGRTSESSTGSSWGRTLNRARCSTRCSKTRCTRAGFTSTSGYRATVRCGRTGPFSTSGYPLTTDIGAACGT